MSRPAKSYSAEYVQAFEKNLFETYPSIKTDSLLVRNQVVKVMSNMGITEYPMWLLLDKNRQGRGVYKLGTYTAPVVKAAKEVANKVAKNKLTGPSLNSQRWSSGLAPAKKVKTDYETNTSYDDSVEFDDIQSLRNEFGLGQFDNNMN